MRLRLAFLNCYNLFPVGVSPRGPQSQAALDAQINDIISTIQSLFTPDLPHMVGLCEVGDEGPAEAVRAGLGLTGQLQWSGPPPGGPAGPQTGLVILHDAAVLDLVPDTLALGTTGAMERQKWMAAAYQLVGGSRGAFWFVVNHWKSNMGGTTQSDPSRMTTAREIGQFYLATARLETEAMILIGDFNCEPGGRPLQEQKDGDNPNALRSVRERALVLRERNRLAYFYNPMWRFMGEPDPYEIACQPGYAAPRLIGSHRGSTAADIDWSLWDHLMVTKPLLLGTALRLVEASVRIVRPIGSASDHCAVAAEFDY